MDVCLWLLSCYSCGWLAVRFSIPLLNSMDCVRTLLNLSILSPDIAELIAQFTPYIDNFHGNGRRSIIVDDKSCSTAARQCQEPGTFYSDTVVEEGQIFCWVLRLDKKSDTNHCCFGNLGVVGSDTIIDGKQIEVFRWRPNTYAYCYEQFRLTGSIVATQDICSVCYYTHLRYIDMLHRRMQEGDILKITIDCRSWTVTFELEHTDCYGIQHAAITSIHEAKYYRMAYQPSWGTSLTIIESGLQ